MVQGLRILPQNVRIPGGAWAILYVLTDPRDDSVRYVGWSSHTPRKRLLEHIAEAGRGRNTHRLNWIRSLQSAGFRPSIKVVALMSPLDVRDAERKLIASYRRHGANLVNETDGGDGLVGFHHTQEVKERLSRMFKGCKCRVTFTEETRQRMAESQRGRKHSEETKRKISERNKGKVVSEETRRKQSVVQRGRVCSEETRRKMSAVRKGRKFTPEHRAALTASLRAFHEKKRLESK